jgi:hypothetical protein
LRALLQRLAEEPSLARDLVANLEGTLTAEGLTLIPAELAMLYHLDMEDLGQTWAITRGATRSVMPTKGMPSNVEEETRYCSTPIRDPMALTFLLLLAGP